MSDLLKIAAFDTEDLTVLSSFVQDAVVKTSEIEHSASKSAVMLPVNRFAWEAKPERRLFRTTYQRRRSVLQFAHVGKVRSQGFDRMNGDEVLSILAIEFFSSESANDPSGVIDVTFSGDAKLRMEVECLETKLTDLGPVWAARGKPKHGA